jgi:hypothetical protein
MSLGSVLPAYFSLTKTFGYVYILEGVSWNNTLSQPSNQLSDLMNRVPARV